MADPAARRSLVDQVHDYIVAKMASRDLDAGDRLIARELAERLSVSRSTVNKAIERLIAEGWVEPDHGHHPKIVTLPVKQYEASTSEFGFSNQTDGCYEELLQLVLRGELKPGEVFKERGLAMQLGVNPATVRRAAEWLRNDGMLERLPRRGWRVCELSGRDIRHGFEIRIALEPMAVSAAIQQITDETLDKLQSTNERLAKLGEAATVYDRRTADHEFHNSILEASGNRILAETLEPLIRKMLLITTVAFRFSRVQRSFEEHLEIVDALRRREEKRAVKLMKSHLRGAKHHHQRSWE